MGALLIVLGVVSYRAWSGTSAPAPAASNGRAATTRPAARGAAGAPSDAPDVRLESLDGQRPKPVAGERNLFTFKPKAPPPPPPSVRQSAPTTLANPTPPAPSGPPPPPPIALKFIGVLEQAGNKPKIALLSDGAGHVFQGFEGGPPIEGRYLILRIGAESIEMSYLDGRGRQTIRLNGS